MKVSNSVDWDIYRIVGAKVGRGNNCGLDIYAVVEVLIGDGEVVE